MAKKIKTGRRKVDPQEKMILVGFYTKTKIVNKAGGIAVAREFAKEKFEAEYA